MILVICMMVVSLCACGGSPKAQLESTEPAGTILEETETDLTIVDQAGRIVTVPKEYDSIALCYRVVIRFLLSLDQGDKIKGIGNQSHSWKFWNRDLRTA